MKSDEGKNYIMSIDSFVDTFSVLDESQTISFSMEMQKKEKGLWESYFSALWEGDRVLVYRRKPCAGIHVVLEVMGVSGKHIKFQKKLGVAKGYEITAKDEEEIDGDFEKDVLVEITDAVYEKICRALIEEFVKSDLETEETADAKGQEEKAGQTPWETIPRVTGAENVLLYGVPGAGKSHEIRTNYCDDPAKMERVVFHPDYTYSDFVGQILSKVRDGQLKYVFTPGPFTRMLKKAWENPGEEHYLIIEEINRGNAPAIFGEIFQLLDRKTEDDGKYDESEFGESEYGISNEEVAGIVYGDGRREVRIPSNMWVLATMNTADQNVFTMDTAFWRRWNMRHIKNDVHAALHAGERIEGSEVTWGNFATVINDMILESGADVGGFEDKRLGAYFVRKRELLEDKFPEKVLKYLWEDAFKMEREAVFDEKFKSLDQVIEAFEDVVWDVSDASRDALEAVLRPEVYRKMRG